MAKFKRWSFLYVMFIVLCIMASCNKKTDLPAAVPKAGKVAFYNVIPNQGAIDFYINGTRQNTNKIAYGDYSGYINITSGQQSVVFRSDSLRTDLFAPQTTTILTDSTTIFVTGRVNAVTTVTARDTAKADAASVKPKFRFINVSADAPAFDVVLNSVTISNQAYKSISPFARVDTGRVALKVNLAGTSTLIGSGTFTLASHGVYTLFVYGSYRSAPGLSFRLVTNH